MSQVDRRGTGQDAAGEVRRLGLPLFLPVSPASRSSPRVFPTPATSPGRNRRSDDDADTDDHRDDRGVDHH